MSIYQKLQSDLPNLVRAIRAKYGYSRKEFAEKTGISEPAVYKIEMGNNDVQLSTLVKIISAFGFELSLNEKNNKVVDVADYIALRYNQKFETLGEDFNQLSNMLMNKLLYFIYLYFLANDKVIFANNFEAWKYGAIYPEIYFKYQGEKKIAPERSNPSARLSEEEKEMIDQVLFGELNLSRFSAIALMHLCHEGNKGENPWKEVYDEDKKNVKIPDHLMDKYAKTIVNSLKSKNNMPP